MSVYEEFGCLDGDCGVVDLIWGWFRGIRWDIFLVVFVLYKLVYVVLSSFLVVSIGWVMGLSYFMVMFLSLGLRVILKGMVFNLGGMCWVYCEEVIFGGVYCEDV